MHISLELRTTYKRPRLLFNHQNPEWSEWSLSLYLDHFRNEILVKVLFSCIPCSHLIMPALYYFYGITVFIAGHVRQAASITKFS